ncbi:MAG: hypothetical protein KAT32_00975 [Candidatus Moranbacteria bacterium]|nr:hypothetical protein [Candidatus Moranbacteria bacterium]
MRNLNRRHKNNCHPQRKNKTVWQGCFYTIPSGKNIKKCVNSNNRILIFYKTRNGDREFFVCKIEKRLKPDKRSSKNWLKVLVRISKGRRKIWKKVTLFNTESDEVTINIPHQLL